MTTTHIVIPTTWNVLHEALTYRLAVQATYHDRPRMICPHAFGWKNGRAKTLIYQTAFLGPHTHDPRGWHSLFVDEIHHATLTDHPWTTAQNHTPHTTGIDTLPTALT